jgi:hypothetical protein
MLPSRPPAHQPRPSQEHAGINQGPWSGVERSGRPHTRESVGNLDLEEVVCRRVLRCAAVCSPCVGPQDRSQRANGGRRVPGPSPLDRLRDQCHGHDVIACLGQRRRLLVAECAVTVAGRHRSPRRRAPARCRRRPGPARRRRPHDHKTRYGAVEYADCGSGQPVLVSDPDSPVMCSANYRSARPTPSICTTTPRCRNRTDESGTRHLSGYLSGTDARSLVGDRHLSRGAMVKLGARGRGPARRVHLRGRAGSPRLGWDHLALGPVLHLPGMLCPTCT